MQNEEADLWENRNLDENSKKQISKQKTNKNNNKNERDIPHCC